MPETKGRVLSVIPEDLRHLGGVYGMELHGANLSTASMLSRWAEDSRIAAFEVFVPASVLADRALLQQISESFLPLERRGRGFLRFYPLAFLGEAWSDTRLPRTLLCTDPYHLARQRFARDRFASGPLPITCDVHSLAHQSLWNELRPLLGADKVPFDSIVSRVSASQQTFEVMARALGGEGAAWPCRFDTIPYSLDLNEFQPVSETEKRGLRASLQWPQNATIALYLGRVNPYSKADLLPLLEIWADVSGPDDWLVIAGQAWPDSYEELLKEQCSALGISEKVRFEGKIEPQQRARYFQAADLFVLPADNIVDTAPSTILEAMACGLPIVVSDWTGMSERFTPEIEGFIAPTQWFPGASWLSPQSPLVPTHELCLALGQMVRIDEAAFSRGLQLLLRQPLRRAQMGQAARARALRDCNWKQISARWIALWDELDVAAHAEMPSERQKRRENANKSATILPYDLAFEHYATTTLDAQNSSIRLSARGHSMLQHGETLFVFQDLMPLVNAEVLHVLLRNISLGRHDNTYSLCDETIAEFEAKGHLYSRPWLLFTLGLLWKRGIIDAIAASQQD